MVDRDPLHDPAAHRDPDEVRALDAEVIEDPERVRDEVVEGVARLARRIGRRAARVAVVVADDVPAGGDEPLAERLLPAVHRPGRAHDQQDGRVSGVTDGVDAQLSAVDRYSRRHLTLAAFRPSSSPSRERRPVWISSAG